MFEALKIPLRVQWVLIDQFNSPEDIKKYMGGSVRKGKDIILCYHYGKLFNTDYDGGYACVLDKVYPTSNEVRFVDPEDDVPKWRVVKIKKLFEAMRAYGAEKMGGFWEIEKI